jgi:hypothetical protein
LEQEFQDVLHELMGDRSLEKFKLEYEKLHKALIKSHERAMKIKNDFDKLKDLNLELESIENKYLSTSKDFDKISLLRNDSEQSFNKAKENSEATAAPN